MELIELLVSSFLPFAPIWTGFEFPLGESAEGLFLRSSGIGTKGVDAQSDFFIGCSSSSCTAMFHSNDGPDGCNVKFWGMEVQVQLSWSKFGKNLIDLLFLHFLWIASEPRVIFDFTMSHLFPVTIAAQNLAQLAIATTDGSPNLVLQSAIITCLKWVIRIVMVCLGKGWWD